MSALTKLVGPAAAILKSDINTDIIAPSHRRRGGGRLVSNTVASEAELAEALFGAWRYDADGSEIVDFVLNRPAFRGAKFILAGPNFACGSSRETAVTMLKAFGIGCVIAPSFGLIFHDNCFRNHMLPLVLDWATVQDLARQAENGAPFTLDLEAATLTPPDGKPIAFAIPAFRRDLLLSGADEVAVTLRRADDIAAYQAQTRKQRPWALLPGG
jgi:3-isopropylmalate/(R)-2-methylmalate dehydratase small subunit